MGTALSPAMSAILPPGNGFATPTAATNGAMCGDAGIGAGRNGQTLDLSHLISPESVHCAADGQLPPSRERGAGPGGCAHEPGFDSPRNAALSSSDNVRLEAGLGEQEDSNAGADAASIEGGAPPDAEATTPMTEEGSCRRDSLSDAGAADEEKAAAGSAVAATHREAEPGVSRTAAAEEGTAVRGVAGPGGGSQLGPSTGGATTEEEAVAAADVGSADPATTSVLHGSSAGAADEAAPEEVAAKADVAAETTAAVVGPAGVPSAAAPHTCALVSLAPEPAALRSVEPVRHAGQDRSDSARLAAASGAPWSIASPGPAGPGVEESPQRVSDTASLVRAVVRRHLEARRSERCGVAGGADTAAASRSRRRSDGRGASHGRLVTAAAVVAAASLCVAAAILARPAVAAVRQAVLDAPFEAQAAPWPPSAGGEPTAARRGPMAGPSVPSDEGMAALVAKAAGAEMMRLPARGLRVLVSADGAVEVDLASAPTLAGRFGRLCLTAQGTDGRGFASACLEPALALAAQRQARRAASRRRLAAAGWPVSSLGPRFDDAPPLFRVEGGRGLRVTAVTMDVRGSKHTASVSTAAVGSSAAGSDAAVSVVPAAELSVAGLVVALTAA